MGEWSLGLRRNPPLRISQPVAARREGAELPEHIDGPAFCRRGVVVDQRLKWRRLGGAPVRVTPGQFQADAWLIRHSNKWLFIDVERSEVLRWASKPYTEEYFELRRVFERHVPSVAFRRGPSEDQIIEPLAVGTLLLNLELQEQRTVRRHFLQRLAALVRAAGPSAPSEVDEPLEALLRRSPILEARRRMPEICAALGGGDMPHVPVHGDLHASNVIVDATGDGRVIDFDSLGLGPFYVDPLRLVTDDRAGFIAGVFNEELAALWDAAGVRRPTSPDSQWFDESVRLMQLADAAVRLERRLRNTKGRARGLKRRIKAAEERSLWDSRAALLP